MKNIIFFIIVSLVCVIVYLTIDIKTNGHAVDSNTLSSSVDVLPFAKGETITYEVKSGGFKIGSSTLIFNGLEDLDGKKAYHISFYTKAASLKDREEIYSDIETYLPIKVKRSIVKKIGFNDNIEEIYDQGNFKVDITSKSKLRTKSYSIQKESPLHNAILLTYFCRAKATFTDKDNFDITLPTVSFKVSYDGNEKIKTPLGEYLAHIFISDPPYFKLWLSADDKKIPLMIQNPNYSLVIKSID